MSCLQNKGIGGVQTTGGIYYKLPLKGVWVIQRGNERENARKTGTVEVSLKELALKAKQPAAHPSSCTNLDCLAVSSL